MASERDQLADIARLENWIRIEREGLERDRQAARDAERAAKEAREARIERENYRADLGRLDHFFVRYAQADAEQRQWMRNGVARLMPVLTGADEYRRNPPDFAELGYEGALLTLGCFLPLSIVRDNWPMLNMDVDGWRRGQFTFTHAAGPAPLDLWRKQLPTIAEYLNNRLDQPVDWTLTQHDPTEVTLHRHARLPANVALDPAWVLDGQLFIGLDPAIRAPVHVALADLPHLLVVGSSGSGKSNGLHVLISSMLQSRAMLAGLYLIDGKGVAFNRYAKLDPKVHIVWEFDAVEALFDRLVALMNERNAAQRATGADNATEDFVIVIIDELASFVAPPITEDKAIKAAHKRFIANLTTLAQKGRSVGIRLIVSVQEPNEAAVPTAVRNNLNGILAFRMPIQQHINAVFGAADGLSAHPGQLTRGRAIFQNGLSGQQCLVQFPLARGGEPLPPVELMALPEPAPPVEAAPPIEGSWDVPRALLPAWDAYRRPIDPARLNRLNPTPAVEWLPSDNPSASIPALPNCQITYRRLMDRSGGKA